MRHDRVEKRSLRRRSGGPAGPEPVEPPAAQPDTAKRAIEKADDLLRRVDRLLSD